MKNKKILIIGIVILLLVAVLSIFLITRKQTNTNKKPKDNSNTKLSLAEEAAKNSNKNVSDYKKFIVGDVLNESTYFNEYTFVSNNTAYIFNPDKLTKNELSYRKVYDIPSDLKVVNIGIPYGADIQFYTNTDEYYSIYDTNTDNKIENSYNMFLNANYALKKFYDSYTMQIYQEKLDYDLIFNLHMVKDDIIYVLTIPFSWA